MASPLISIVIPYYRRQQVFENCLDSVFQQDYPNREIIVVDNHSEDGLKEHLGVKCEAIRLIELPSNLGACAARNRGIEAAKGEILVFIDDDVSLVHPSALTRIVETFEAHSGLGALALQVCDPNTRAVRIREWCHTRPCSDFADQEFETNWFGEGASAIRRTVFESCGLYYEPFFYGAEGHDLIVRLLDHGFRILHTPRIQVFHWAPNAGASGYLGKQYYYYTRNFLWMAYKDYRLADGLVFIVPKL